MEQYDFVQRLGVLIWQMDEDFTYWWGKLAIHTTFIIWTTEKEKNL